MLLALSLHCFSAYLRYLSRQSHLIYVVFLVLCNLFVSLSRLFSAFGFYFFYFATLLQFVFLDRSFPTLFAPAILPDPFRCRSVRTIISKPHYSQFSASTSSYMKHIPCPAPQTGCHFIIFRRHSHNYKMRKGHIFITALRWRQGDYSPTRSLWIERLRQQQRRRHEMLHGFLMDLPGAYF